MELPADKALLSLAKYIPTVCLISRIEFIVMLFKVLDIFELLLAMDIIGVRAFLRMITSPDDIKEYTLFFL